MLGSLDMGVYVETFFLGGGETIYRIYWLCNEMR